MGHLHLTGILQTAFGSSVILARIGVPNNLEHVAHVRFGSEADSGPQNRQVRFVPIGDIRSFDVVNYLLVDGASKRQLSLTAQRLCDALNCLRTIRIGRGQFRELVEIRQRALQSVLSFP